MSLTLQNQVTEVNVTPTPTKVNITSVGVQGAQGIQGVQGVPGPNDIGGYTIEITSPSSGDLLQFNSSSKWVNSPQANITDGGNF